MIRLIFGIALAMAAADAPHDAPLYLVIITATIGVIIAAFGVRKLNRKD